MDKQETLKCLKLCSSIWSNFSFTQETVAAFQLVFAKVDYQDALMGIQYLAQNHFEGFAPTIPEFYQAVRKVKFVSEDFETAEIAWSKKYNQDSETGKQAWKQSGCDRRYGLCENKDLPFLRKEFLDIYNALKEKTQHKQNLKALIPSETLKRIV